MEQFLEKMDNETIQELIKYYLKKDDKEHLDMLLNFMNKDKESSKDKETAEEVASDYVSKVLKALITNDIESMRDVLSYLDIEQKIINQLFMVIIHYSNLEMVKFFLDEMKVDPSIDGNEAIVTASYLESNNIVKLLLNDPRVDPSVGSNEVLCHAVKNGDAKLVELLLKDPRVNPNDIYRDIYDTKHNAFDYAVFNGYYEVVKLLLNDNRLKLFTYNTLINDIPYDKAFSVAINNNNYDIVELLQTHNVKHLIKNKN